LGLHTSAVQVYRLSADHKAYVVDPVASGQVSAAYTELKTKLAPLFGPNLRIDNINFATLECQCTDPNGKVVFIPIPDTFPEIATIRDILQNCGYHKDTWVNRGHYTMGNDSGPKVTWDQSPEWRTALSHAFGMPPETHQYLEHCKTQIRAKLTSLVQELAQLGTNTTPAAPGRLQSLQTEIQNLQAILNKFEQINPFYLAYALRVGQAPDDPNTAYEDLRDAVLPAMPQKRRFLGKDAQGKRRFVADKKKLTPRQEDELKRIVAMAPYNLRTADIQKRREQYHKIAKELKIEPNMQDPFEDAFLWLHTAAITNRYTGANGPQIPSYEHPAFTVLRNMNDIDLSIPPAPPPAPPPPASQTTPGSSTRSSSPPPGSTNTPPSADSGAGVGNGSPPPP
jgi:hypothetical protein